MHDAQDSEVVFTLYHQGIDEEETIFIDQFEVHITTYCQNRTCMSSSAIRLLRENGPLEIIIKKTYKALKNVVNIFTPRSGSLVLCLLRVLLSPSSSIICRSFESSDIS